MLWQKAMLIISTCFVMTCSSCWWREFKFTVRSNKITPNSSARPSIFVGTRFLFPSMSVVAATGEMLPGSPPAAGIVRRLAKHRCLSDPCRLVLGRQSDGYTINFGPRLHRAPRLNSAGFGCFIRRFNEVCPKPFRPSPSVYFRRSVQAFSVAQGIASPVHPCLGRSRQLGHGEHEEDQGSGRMSHFAGHCLGPPLSGYIGVWPQRAAKAFQKTARPQQAWSVSRKLGTSLVRFGEL